MKKTELKEMHLKTNEELVKLLSDLKTEVSKLTMDITLAKSKNSGLLNEKKKNIARVLTILTEKGGRVKNG